MQTLQGVGRMITMIFLKYWVITINITLIVLGLYYQNFNSIALGMLGFAVIPLLNVVIGIEKMQKHEKKENESFKKWVKENEERAGIK